MDILNPFLLLLLLLPGLTCLYTAGRTSTLGYDPVTARERNGTALMMIAARGSLHTWERKTKRVASLFQKDLYFINFTPRTAGAGPGVPVPTTTPCVGSRDLKFASFWTGCPRSFPGDDLQRRGIFFLQFSRYNLLVDEKGLFLANWQNYKNDKNTKIEKWQKW